VREFAPAQDGEWRAVWDAWKHILDDLERDPLSTADRLDWSAKYGLIEQFREAEKLARDDPWLRSLDLAYHLLDRSEGLFFALLESGALRLPYAFEDISSYELHPPLTTRAALRGSCIEKFGPLVESAQWDAVILKDKGRRIELDLSDVFSIGQVNHGRAVFAAAHTPADLLSLPFAKLI
jgi:proteasome accessory factor A